MSTIINRPVLKENTTITLMENGLLLLQDSISEVLSPLDGKVMAKAAHSAKQDIEMAVDAASEAFKTWSETSATERSIIFNKIADRIEENLPFLLL